MWITVVITQKCFSLYHKRGLKHISTVCISRVEIELDHNSLQPTMSVEI